MRRRDAGLWFFIIAVVLALIVCTVLYNSFKASRLNELYGTKFTWWDIVMGNHQLHRNITP